MSLADNYFTSPKKCALVTAVVKVSMKNVQIAEKHWQNVFYYFRNTDELKVLKVPKSIFVGVIASPGGPNLNL